MRDRYLGYLDLLNRLGVDHQCDERTDRKTNIETDWPLAVALSND